MYNVCAFASLDITQFHLCNVNQLLQPMFPGSFPNVRRNLFNTVLVMDLSRSSNVYFIATAVANIVNRGLPFRFGVVPIINDEDSESLILFVGNLLTMCAKV